MQTGKHTLKIPFVFSTLEPIALKVLPKAQCSLRLRDSFGNINSISKFPIATKIHIFKKWEQMRRQQWVLVSVLQMISWQMYSSPDQKPSGDLIMTVLTLKWPQKRPESQHFWKYICLPSQQNFVYKFGARSLWLVHSSTSHAGFTQLYLSHLNPTPP